MKIFLDTAKIDEIKKGVEWGLVDGVTTNPTLIAKAGTPFKETIKEICQIVRGPVSAEVVSLDWQEMVKEARELAKIDDYVVVKIPMTPDGLKAVKILSAEGIKTNVTLVFSANQALLAAKAGATYVSPFVGRMDDIANDGMGIVDEIITIYSNYGFETEVIVASVRHPKHVLESALMGADIVTIPFNVLEKLFHHPMTEIGIKRFLDDWKKYQTGR
ncbi:transaldolase [Thermosipho affectus]|uniref:Probable transaldolase n=1 Tax=Thermosipho affectus TaxID=660294 RepID=A0ABX3IIP4_9BACT|nr:MULTISPECIES: fructose-6-phosphate aldolase [Thermosipho]ONN26533.1 transaldolase [Thermosipho affectus]OOC42367.1 transaldolase [Thermosipho sp. 1074]